MKTQFETEKEAQEALNGERGKALGFCPLINENCKTACVCYYKGSTKKDPFKDRYNVYYPCCANVLISGEISTI